MSTTPDSALADPQQIIADLQRANAELQRRLDESNAERNEALEQQTATAEMLGVINSSPGDLAPVFEAILDKAHGLCGSALGELELYEDGKFRAVAMRGVSGRLAELLRQPFVPPSHSPLARLLAGEQIVQITDLSELARQQPENLRAQAGAECGLRTVLFVPLRKDGVLLGAILAYRREGRPFSDKKIALLENFAAQAVIAMENARLLTETREALEQQTATAEVLHVINSSPGDLAAVFDAVLDKATRFCDAAFGTLWTYDGERFKAVALRQVPEAYAEFLSQAPLRPVPFSGLGRVAGGESVAHFVDVAANEAYSGGDPALQALLKLGKARSTVAVPLRKDDTVLGAITAYRQEVRPFSEKQIALLQNFAAQAVIAMENARLLTETREALEQQTATAEVLQVINSSPGDLAPVFDAMVERAARLCEADEAALRTFDGELLHLVAVRGSEPDVVKGLRQLGPTRAFGLYEPFARGARVVHIADVRETDIFRENPVVRERLELRGIRTWLAVALPKDGILLGVINVHRHTTRPFTDKQIALLENFAAQAVIAMENARLITETREALDQQTATAEVLQVINSSPGDLAPVFDAMLDKAMRLCEAAFGKLMTYDGERFQPAAARGVPTAYAEFVAGTPLQYGRGTGPDRILQGERLVHVVDVAAEDAYRAGEPNRRALVDLGGARTSLVVPLRKDDTLLGVIQIYRQEVRPFTDRQISLLQNFAVQAVIAIENARLITETREALEQQTATAEVLQVINSSPGDLAPVFEAMLDKAIRLCEAAHGHLLTYDGECFHPAAASGEPHYVEWARQVGAVRPAPSAPLGRISRGERIVHIADLREEEVYPTVPAFREQADIRGARSQITVGLLKDNTLLGAMIVYRQEVRPFSDKQIALLENFAVQAVIAMENARLLGELHQRTDEIAEWNRELEARVAEQVEELGRVGRLKRFLAPQLAELIVSQGDEKILESHRREIVVVFCDLRGYTAFTETAEPEEVLDFLRQYHGALGPLVSQFEGTLDQFSGDGIMVFFNDPMPCPDPAERAVKMAMSMRQAARELIAAWSRHGCELGFGIGIAQGYATLGQIGFSERSGYTAIGTVCNLAARLCAEAQDGQILVSSRVAGAVGALARLEDLGNVELKGLRRPVAAFNVAEQVSDAPAHP